MPTIDFGKVKGDNGASMRTRGAWTPATEYKNDEQYIDVITNRGSSYACKTTHTSDATFSDSNWNLIAQKGDKGDKGDKGNKGDNGITPIIEVGTATSLDASASPTVSATTNGNTTTFNFGIPKGDISEVKTPTFDDSVGTYTTLSAANTAAETASNAIKSKVSIFTTLSNAKKSFSAIVQGLKILATNVGAINGITDSLTSTSSNVAASAAAVKALNDKTTQLNSNLTQSTNGKFVLPNGLKICWGRCDSGVITFPVTFAANPTVVATYLNSNTDIRMCVHFTAISTTAARYSGGFKQGDGWSGNYTAGVNWIAIGY